jgi:hypothetical protein
MARAHRSRPKALLVQRCFEASRLGEELLAAAYGLALPLLRQPLPTAPRRGPEPKQRTDHHPKTGGPRA